jgi:hypothetical protein
MSDTSAAPVPENTHPSLSMRWLGAVPMFTTFAAVVWMSSRSHVMQDVCELYRIDLPLPTKLAFVIRGFMERYYGLMMPGMFAVCWLYFGWAAKNKKRLLWFSSVAFLVCALVVLLMESSFLTSLKLHNSEHKR